ncbi:hypothetical protein E2562_001034 [Oryza meyeriana var. granulata]|uniref:Uncharacterized protein n=1 Tax=Oryza meyeriana var. granulata TaxID=110450 RepID=A0A6G1EBY6_9ORYZ|nr:hypothetical protein E2562_001034 [Oryza meyeriana var. granulata]
MLLMVVRLGTTRPRRSPTSAFRVFQREDRDVISDTGKFKLSTTGPSCRRSTAACCSSEKAAPDSTKR